MHCPPLHLLLPHRGSRGFCGWKRAGEQGGSEPGTKMALTERGSRILGPDPQFHAETLPLKHEPQPFQHEPFCARPLNARSGVTSNVASLQSFLLLGVGVTISRESAPLPVLSS